MIGDRVVPVIVPGDGIGVMVTPRIGWRVWSPANSGDVIALGRSSMSGKVAYAVQPPSKRWFERITKRIRLDRREAERLTMLIASTSHSGDDVELAGMMVRNRMLLDRLLVNCRALKNAHALLVIARDQHSSHVASLLPHSRGIGIVDPVVPIDEAISRWVGLAFAVAKAKVAASRDAREAREGRKVHEAAERVRLEKAVTKQKPPKPATPERVRPLPSPPPPIAPSARRPEGVGHGNTLGMSVLDLRAYQHVLGVSQRELCQRLGSPWHRGTLVRVFAKVRHLSENLARVLLASIDSLDDERRARYDTFVREHKGNEA